MLNSSLQTSNKNHPIWGPKWTQNAPQNEPQNGPQNGPKWASRAKPLWDPSRRPPGGPKPYKTNENDPRETCGARRTESAGLRVAMWLPNSSDHKTNPIESTIYFVAESLRSMMKRLKTERTRAQIQFPTTPLASPCATPTHRQQYQDSKKATLSGAFQMPRLVACMQNRRTRKNEKQQKRRRVFYVVP